MSGSEQASDHGVISGDAFVDFSHLTSPEDLAAISRIEKVAAVVVPESLAAAYARIPSSQVAATVFIPAGANVRVHTGSLTVGGDGLGSPEDVLVVIGMLLITSPVTGPLPRRISVVGLVLAPRGSESTLGPVLGGGAGNVMYYPAADGQDFKVHSGQSRLSGAMLANTAGQPQDILIAAGQLVITSPVTALGYAQVIVAGIAVAPEASRELLEPKMQTQGLSAWYRGDQPRIISEDSSLGADFFRLLDHPVSLIVLADLSIDQGVSEATLREKVTDIVLFGELTAPADLVPMLQVLAADAFGTIRASDGLRS
jgi:hypothetical protein